MASKKELPPKFGLADLNMTEDEEGYQLGKRVVASYWETAVVMTPTQCEQMLQHIRNKDFLIPSYAKGSPTCHPLYVAQISKATQILNSKLLSVAAYCILYSIYGGTLPENYASHIVMKFGKEVEYNHSEAYFKIYPELRPKNTEDNTEDKNKDDIKDEDKEARGKGLYYKKIVENDKNTDGDELDAPPPKRQRLNEDLIAPAKTLTVKKSATVVWESEQAPVAKTAGELQTPTDDTWSLESVLTIVSGNKLKSSTGENNKPGFSMRRRRQESLANLAKGVTETKQLMKKVVKNQDRMQLSLDEIQSTLKKMAEQYHDNEQERRTNIGEVREYMMVMANAVKELRDDIKNCDY